MPSRSGARSGETATTGVAPGCLDAVVSGLAVSDITADTAQVDVSVEADNTTVRPVYWRLYDLDAGSVLVSTTTITPPGGSFQLSLSGKRHRLEASLEEHLPAGTTRAVTFSTAEGAAITQEPAEFPLAGGTEISFVACAEHEDLLVTLHDGDGLLSRYQVDVLPALPPPVVPSFAGSSYTTASLCGTVVAGNSVTTQTATNAAGYYLATEQDYALFQANSNTGEITVNALGANEFESLPTGAVQLYGLRLVGENTNGQDSLQVAVQYRETC